MELSDESAADCPDKPRLGATSTSVPYYDKDTSSRVLSIVGLVFSWAIAITAIIVGVIAENQNWTLDLCWSPPTSLLILAQNFIITICNESLGYIHTLSLRWTLQEKGQLDFNSHLRLVLSPQSLGPNAWYCNLLMTMAMVSTYGASALTFNVTQPGTCLEYMVSGDAWIILGCGIMAQASIATWSLLYHSSWATWSSDVMDVAAACTQVHTDGLCHQHGRGMQGVDNCREPNMPTLPSPRQPSAFHSHSQVRLVVYALWTAVLLLIVYMATLFIYIRIYFRRYTANPFSAQFRWWAFLPDSTGEIHSLVTIPLTGPTLDAEQAGMFTPKDFAWVFVLLTVLQCLVTLPLHCAELVVNLSRDETKWRTASSKHGQRRNSNVLISLLNSWQPLTLFLLKPFIHWVYSLTLSLDLSELSHGLSIWASQVLYLTLFMLGLAVFVTILSLWRYKGPQPSTFGHLQTMVDLIDEWPQTKKERLYWGDKGEAKTERFVIDLGNGVRHAGTSNSKEGVEAIDMMKLYE